MRLILATLLALVLLPAAAIAQEPAVAQAPAVVTGPAEDVGFASATLTGTVDPMGEARSYHFELGTTTAYGLSTAVEQTGAGAGPQTVSADVTGLAPATTYYYRLVADNGVGEPRSFRTTASPSPPGISQLRASERKASSARVSALVDPNGTRTLWHVEWGLSTGFGNRTASVEIPAGTRAVPVSAVLDRLPSYKRIYWRVVAENAGGVTRSGRASFVTARAPSSLSLSRSVAVTTWGRSVSFNGTVRGSGVNGLTIALQQDSFPFDTGFNTVDTARTNRHGLFRFPARAVFAATRYRAVPLIAPDMSSSVRGVSVRSRVKVHRGVKTRRAVWLQGGVNPALPTGRATLQRKTRSGWRSVAGAALTPASEFRSTYAFKVFRKKRTAALYRIRVSPRDGGAHVRGYSKAISVGKKQKRQRRG